MKFLIEANMRRSVGTFLQAAGHDVRFLTGTTDRDLPDDQVLELAVRENRVLLTNDRDFGTLIYQRRRAHSGVIFFRLKQESTEAYTTRLSNVVMTHHDALRRLFIIVEDDHVRVR